MSQRSDRVFITTCPQGHVVIILRDRDGNEICQAHLEPAVAVNIGSDICLHARSITSLLSAQAAGHA